MDACNNIIKPTENSAKVVGKYKVIKLSKKRSKYKVIKMYVLFTTSEKITILEITNIMLVKKCNRVLRKSSNMLHN